MCDKQAFKNIMTYGFAGEVISGGVKKGEKSVNILTVCYEIFFKMC